MKVIILILSLLLTLSLIALAQTSSRPPHRPPVIPPYDVEQVRLILIDVVGTLKETHEGYVLWANTDPTTHVPTLNNGYIPKATIDGVKGWIDQQQDLANFWAAHETTLHALGNP